MQKIFKKFIFLALVCLLSGCASFGPWTKIKGGEYKDGARKFSAIAPADWMRFNMAKFFIMTKDGTVLDQIAVEMHRIDKKLEFTKKMYFKEMTIQDLAEIEIDNFKSNTDVSAFEITQNTPVMIDGREGFKVEYTYTAKGGLPVRGIHYGLMRDNFVYRIHYEAAAQHYFEKYKNDFERFIESFKLIK